MLDPNSVISGKVYALSLLVHHSHLAVNYRDGIQEIRKIFYLDQIEKASAPELPPHNDKPLHHLVTVSRRDLKVSEKSS